MQEAKEHLHTHITALNHTIETVSCLHLEPYCIPHPWGVRWWNEACSVA